MWAYAHLPRHYISKNQDEDIVGPDRSIKVISSSFYYIFVDLEQRTLFLNHFIIIKLACILSFSKFVTHLFNTIYYFNSYNSLRVQQEKLSCRTLF